MPEAEQPTRCDGGGMIRSTRSAQAIYSLITICRGEDRRKRHTSDRNIRILHGRPAYDRAAGPCSAHQSCILYMHVRQLGSYQPILPANPAYLHPQIGGTARARRCETLGLPRCHDNIAESMRLSGQPLFTSNRRRRCQGKTVVR